MSGPPVAALAERGGAGGKITKTTPNDKKLQFTGPLFARNVTTRLRVGAVLGGAYITALVRRSLGESGSGPPILSRSKPCYAEGIVSKIVKKQHFQAKNGQNRPKRHLLVIFAPKLAKPAKPQAWPKAWTSKTAFATPSIG